MKNNKWDKRFIELAKLISTWSKDKSTKVGAVIVDQNNRIISIGYNGPPSGFPDEEEYIHIRPTKYFYFEHAERNAIYNAARIGVSTIGHIMYCVDSREEHLFSCADCARAIIQSGISKLVIYKPGEKKDNNWDESTKAALNMLNKCNVKIEYYEE